jgi:hypothetical protein
MNPTPIRIIVEVTSSFPDTNGNRYHFARFWNAQKGRQESVAINDISGVSNARAVAYELAGRDYEATLVFERAVTKTEFRKLTRGTVFAGYEGAEAVQRALADLMRVTRQNLDAG